MYQRVEQRRVPQLLVMTVVVLLMAVVAVLTTHASQSAARGAAGPSMHVHVPSGAGLSEAKPAEGSDAQTSDCRSADVGLTF